MSIRGLSGGKLGLQQVPGPAGEDVVVVKDGGAAGFQQLPHAHDGAVVNTHLCETKDEERYVLEKHGKRPLAYMEDLGWVRGSRGPGPLSA